jgi:hypothetical protein
VPEADTWAMLLAGLGLLGWQARRAAPARLRPPSPISTARHPAVVYNFDILHALPPQAARLARSPFTLQIAINMSISIKTAEDIEGMRVAGRLGSEVLDYITPFVKPASPPANSTACATNTWSTCRAPSRRR